MIQFTAFLACAVRAFKRLLLLRWSHSGIPFTSLSIRVDIAGPAWLSADREFQSVQPQSGSQRKDDYEKNGTSPAGKAFSFQMPPFCPGRHGLRRDGLPAQPVPRRTQTAR